MWPSIAWTFSGAVVTDFLAGAWWPSWAADKVARKAIRTRRVSEIHNTHLLVVSSEMGNKIVEVDEYIKTAAPFSRPILKRLRRTFHKASPEISEAIKWGIPYFEYKGLLGGMAAFQNHVSFGFWRSKEMKDPHGLFQQGAKASMCNVKVTSVDQLPSDSILNKYILAAMKLNEPLAQAKRKATPPKPRPPLRVPEILAKALKKNKKANAFFESLSPSCRREYVEWIAEAKREQTKTRRTTTAITWLAEGKKRNWKYTK